jgi:hypothetical protein
LKKCGGGGWDMQSCGTTPTTAALPKAEPFLLRLVSKFVLEVLPASLASMIGALLLAHYHFAAPAVLAGATPAAAPASPEMMQLVRDEHNLIRDFVIAQQAAQKSRYATADAQSAQTADAELAATAAPPPASVVAAKPLAAHARTAAVAAISPAPAPAPHAALPAAPQAAPLAIAGLQDNAAPPPVHGPLVATTLAMKDHVVSATVHAVMTIGGIPSWIGHRLGGNEADSGERTISAAS